ncbi:MAG: hypothetical protein IJU89_04640 [Alphaproteobacteria bacterium]|nr:hypothetical protein [Alphaproteobacteria bacterium]
MAKKSNVFLSSAFNIHGLSGCKQCGVFETNALHGLITDIKNAQSGIKKIAPDVSHPANVVMNLL